VRAFGDAVPVPAVGRDDLIALFERRAHAHRHRLLTDVAVHDAVDLAGVVIGRGPLLEPANGLHLAQHGALLVTGKVHGRAPYVGIETFHGERALTAWQQGTLSPGPAMPTPLEPRPGCRSSLRAAIWQRTADKRENPMLVCQQPRAQPVDSWASHRREDLGRPVGDWKGDIDPGTARDASAPCAGVVILLPWGLVRA